MASIMKTVTAPTNFSKFTRLPKEIRDMIWDTAIRDERPGAHFFEMTPTTPGKVGDLNICGQAPSEKWLEEYQYTTSKGCAGATTPGDRSIYKVDTPLYTTCWESREAVQRHNRIGSRVGKFELPSGAINGSSGVYKDEQGQSQPFNVKTQDLLCFQGDKLPREEYLWQDLPFIKNANREKGAVNVAIEFDPTWKAPTEGDFEFQKKSRVESSFVAAKKGLEHVWLIDYRLRRTPVTEEALKQQKSHKLWVAGMTNVSEGDGEVEATEKSQSDDEHNDDEHNNDEVDEDEVDEDEDTKTKEQEDPRQVFRGKGCIFTEVRPFDAGWELSDGTPMYPRHLDTAGALGPEPMISFNHTSPFDFINEAEKNSWKIAYNGKNATADDCYNGCLLWEDDKYCGHHMNGAQFHVLAYEECE